MITVYNNGNCIQVVLLSGESMHLDQIVMSNYAMMLNIMANWQ